MRILITGADTPLGASVARALRGAHEVRLTGREPTPPTGLEGFAYTPSDLREPDAVTPLLEGIEAVAHLALHARLATPDWQTEAWALDWAARGTHVLVHAARRAGAGRVVIASRLELMERHGETARVNEAWRPLPRAEAASLAPYLAELTVREFARLEPIAGVCLRMGNLGSAPDETTEADAVEAVSRAVTMELPETRARWWLYHVGSGPRYPLTAAAEPPLSLVRGGA